MGTWVGFDVPLGLWKVPGLGGSSIDTMSRALTVHLIPVQTGPVGFPRSLVRHPDPSTSSVDPYNRSDPTVHNGQPPLPPHFTVHKTVPPVRPWFRSCSNSRFRSLCYEPVSRLLLTVGCPDGRPLATDSSRSCSMTLCDGVDLTTVGHHPPPPS